MKYILNSNRRKERLLNEKKGNRAFGETEKIASTPRPGIEPGPQANADEALPLSYQGWLIIIIIIIIIIITIIIIIIIIIIESNGRH